MNLDELLRQTLQDDRYALPSWPDASTRVRAGIRRRRRRRAAMVLAGIAALATLAAPAAVLGLSTGQSPTTAHPSATPAPKITPSPGQVIPWQGRPATPPASARHGYHDLVAWIDVASSAEPGSDLAYVVTLINPSGHEVSLDPCPVFTQRLGPDGGSYLLNCTVQALPAHSWIRLQMRLHVSTTAPAGTNDLSWAIDTANGQAASASTPITIR